jgi:hypothetical protein
MILYDLCLLPAQFCYVIIYERNLESQVLSWMSKSKLILSLSYIAAERTWNYSEHISRDRYPASLLARRSDLQKIHHVVSVHCCVTSLRTR